MEQALKKRVFRKMTIKSELTDSSYRQTLQKYQCQAGSYVDIHFYNEEME